MPSQSMGPGRRKRWSRFFIRSEPQQRLGAALNILPDQARAFPLTKKSMKTKTKPVPCTYLSDDDSSFIIVHTFKPSSQLEDEPTPSPSFSRESSALKSFGSGFLDPFRRTNTNSSETSPTMEDFTSDIGMCLGVGTRSDDRRLDSGVASEYGHTRLSCTESQDDPRVGPHSPNDFPAAISVSSPPSSFRIVKRKGARPPTPPAPCRHSPSCPLSLSLPQTCGPLQITHHLSKLKDKVDIDLTLFPPDRQRDSTCSSRIISSIRDEGGLSLVTPTTQPVTDSPAVPVPSEQIMRSISLCPTALHNDVTVSPPPPHTTTKLVKRRPSVASSHRDHEKQKALPPIRAQSPFRVNLPHGQSSPIGIASQRFPPVTRPSARPVSISTDVLASLAWIGTPPSFSPTSSSPPPPYSSNHLVCDLGISIPVHDESLSDDVLVERLEKFRKEASASKRSSRSRLVQGPIRTNTITSQASSNSSEGSSSSFSCSLPPPVPSLPPMYVSPKGSGPEASEAGHDAKLEDEDEEDTDSEDTAIWCSARKALLCVREIVRTERSYQDALRTLLRGDTLTPPPVSMLTHIPPLIRASEILLHGMTEDPSAWGVSTAFMSIEDEVEDALVAWSAVAGEFFEDRRGHRLSRGPSGSKNDPEVREKEREGRKVLRRSMPPPVSRLSGSRRSFGGRKSQEQHDRPVGELSSVPTLPEFMNGFAGSNQQYLGMQHRWSSSNTSTSEAECKSDQPQEMPSVKKRYGSTERLGSRKGSSKAPSSQPVRRPSVRDLAIQPTQRVMRYVLLYRDLLESTPQLSPSRALVERALEAAKRIAEKCDHAQGHSAFRYGDSPNLARRGS
ncbi:hypothetical protein CONPUDRAFT_141264 [Coniophora puteana RWD-64-598 SS2]|uniref:DH domain-containing protein n=1 Tax=Coniophora puteana (strain RWD-64-598) TaxID=741705 RepID=A0A5M3N7Y5_CONPW|nr:uncharacterized protein CONPUDRAFT_141264 [Coniophora puteana RWD-64-598 SS2]EIW86955.1 hypothetical protein CONPUDRAFT_141264 [Coniophora puteana RWD-64-598 SS2]